MALNHTIILPTYRGSSSLGLTSALKVTGGGSSLIPSRHMIQSSQSFDPGYVKQCFCWNGNVYFPIGRHDSSASGWGKYHHESDKIEICLGYPIRMQIVPIKDRVLFYETGKQGWGYDAEERDYAAGATVGNPFDYIVVGDVFYGLDTSAKKLLSWDYPFAAAPVFSSFTPTFFRICELGGEVYGCMVNSGTGTLDLYKASGGTFSLIGTPSSFSNLINYTGTVATQYAFFKFNGKLFLALHTDVIGQPRLRLFEFDEVTGGSVERTSWLPSEWQTTVATATTGKIFEIRDDLGNTEQVFLIRSIFAGGWEMYEFQEGTFISIASGAEILYPWSGVVYDPEARAAEIKSAQDTVPSDHVEMQIEVFDLKANSAVDIDPRFRFDYSEPPPYSECTGKTPHADKVNLASMPSGITSLADLSDDFSSAILNTELWKPYGLSLNTATTFRDFGAGYTIDFAPADLKINGGVLRFGKASQTVGAYHGQGVKGLWSILGEFVADITVEDISSLQSVASVQYPLVCLFRISPNEGFGFFAYNISGTTYVKGVYMTADTAFVFSSQIACSDGDKIRITRDGSNVWTIIHDPDGSPTDITPAGGAAYSEPVNLIMGCIAASGAPGYWTAIGTPPGSEPGIADVAISGAGSIRRCLGGMLHQFDWDHIVDLGTNKIGTAELFVDTEVP